MERHVLCLFVPVLLILYVPFSGSCVITPATSYVRPAHITTALETNQNVYYLGVGSNLLKEKVLNRGINGSTISVKSFGPASVDNHRLAFNMRGMRLVSLLYASITLHLLIVLVRQRKFHVFQVIRYEKYLYLLPCSSKHGTTATYRNLNADRDILLSFLAFT